jgi:uncharacterized OsmC-like protein
MKAIVESIGNVGSRSQLGSHEVVFDQPLSVRGGQDRGPSPLDVMVLSVGACAHYFAAAYLYGRGHATNGVAVQVEWEKERLPVSRVGRLTIKVRLPAGLSDREIAGVERAIKGCPAYGTLRYPPTVELTVEAEPFVGDQRHTA